MFIISFLFFFCFFMVVVVVEDFGACLMGWGLI